MVRKLAAAFAVLLFVLICGVWSLLEWPKLWLNDRSLELARSYLGKHGIADLTWRKGSIDVVSESLLRKRLKVSLESVCYLRPDVVQACFETVQARAVVDLSRMPPGLAEVGPVRADGGSFRLLPVRVSGSIAAEGKKARSLKELKLGVKARATLVAGKVRARAGIEGEASLREIRARVTGDAVFPGGSPIRVRGCELSTTRAPSGGLLRADCMVEGYLPKAKALSEGRWRALGLPDRAAVRVTAGLKTASFFPDPAERVNGRVEARIDPVRTMIYNLVGGASVDVDAVPLELPAKGKLEARADLKLGTPRFERLARRLEGGPWAVWAPLRNLSGSIQIAASGDIDMSGGRVPLQLATRLKSPSQKLDIDATGMLELGGLRGRTRSRADLDVVLSDVQLELPRLDLAAPPRLLPDSRVASVVQHRIGESAGTAPEGTPLDYRIRVHTPPDRSARVLSNLARAPVPVAVDLALERESPLAGSVALQSFPVRFFNREATIDHLQIHLKQPQPESPIDGMVRIDLADYTFRVLARGTIGKPGFTFESDPPLSQNQILSVLIYGRAPEELDSDESATVGSTEAAVRDHAIGLASFFMLGSTPVQGLAYDPKTKALQIKFRVAEGTSLNIGVGDLHELGIRRRLGKDWSITTDVAKGTGDTNVLSAFLEWAHRY